MVISWDKSQGIGDVTQAADTIGELSPAEPPPAGVAGAKDVAGQDASALPADRPLGRRAAAALVDLGLLAGLFVILSLIAGRTSPAFGPFTIFLRLLSITVNGQPVISVSLYGAWAVLYLTLLPAYYFALEAAAGQTVGKALLGLRVLRLDGRRPSGGQIAGRTLLRLIDWLPVLYLAGFITLLATGRRRRQRIGDLAAGTIVTREQPARHRGLAVASVVLVAVAVAGLSAYRMASPESSNSYRGHGISFSYPAGWQEESWTSSRQLGASPQWRVVISPGTQGDDGIVLEEYRLSHPVGAANFAALAAQLQRLLQNAASQDGGAVQAGPQPITIAGLPGLRFRATGIPQGGIPVVSTLTFAFHGTTEYEIDCQTTRPAAAAVAAACSQVIRTFKPTRPPGAASPIAPPAHGTAPVPLTRTQRWLTGLTSLQEHLSTAMPAAEVPVTPGSLRAAATALRRCSLELARLGPPTRSLQPAYQLARQACHTFQPGARCFATAARVLAASGGNAAKLPALFACIQASTNRGTDLIASAVASGSSIQPREHTSAPPSLT